jgi:SAM-dependent methyltransferase
MGTHRSSSPIQNVVNWAGTLFARSPNKLMSEREAASHRARLSELYRTRFGLTMDPLQSDPAVVPAAEVIKKVQGSNKADPTTFLGLGWQHAATIIELLSAHGWDVSQMGRMLDFGVGTGRLLLQFLPFSMERYGCDVNPVAVDWASQSLGRHAQIRLTGLEPPLPYADSMFDLVTAFSVFTHTPFHSQAAWIAELWRVIRPGGCIVASVHDFSRIGANGQKGIKEIGVRRGLNMNIYMSEKSFRETWSRGFEIVDILPKQPRQTLFLARRLASRDL